MKRLLGGLLFLILASQALAEDCNFPAHDLSVLPHAGDEPVSVGIHMYLSDLTEIHDSHQSFVGDVFFRVQWLDPRLVHGGEQDCFVEETDIWTPQLQLLNRRTLQRARDPQYTVAPDGRVTQKVRLYGEFSYRADLTDFPFDEQQLSFILVSGYGPEEVGLQAQADHLAIGETLSVANWLVQLRGSEPGEHYVASLGRSLSRLDIIFDAQRLTGFYTWQLLVPLILVVMMTWAVFWIPREFVPPRVGLVATSMLTLIAYRFAMSSILPPIAYLTRLDLFMVASSLLVFGALAATVAVTWLDGRGDTRQAEVLNVVSRALAPGLFLAVFVKVFLM